MRRKFTESERQQYLAELKASGETPWGFARRIGITPANLYRWMRLQREGSRPTFARLVRESSSGVATPAAERRISVQVGDALVHVESGFDAGLLRDVVTALVDQRRQT
jgi:transposase-like protein